MMFPRVFLSFLVLKLGCTQLNDYILRPNNKFAVHIGVRAPSSQLQELSAFDEDGSEKNVFGDDGAKSVINKHDEEKLSSEVEKQNALKWSNEGFVFHSNGVINRVREKHLTEDVSKSVDPDDSFIFTFREPENVFPWKYPFNYTGATLAPATINNAINNNRTVNFYTDNVSFNVYKEVLSENICTYMKENDCYQNKGVVNNNMTDSTMVHKQANHQLICCILPLQNKDKQVFTNIFIPDVPNKISRFKRTPNSAQQQRNILLYRQLDQREHKPRPATQIKIVTPEYEYGDPYSNIKNLKNPDKEKKDSTVKFEYVNVKDEDEDYIVEIPKPGLVGLYSDNGKRPPPSKWSVSKPRPIQGYGVTQNTDDDDDDDDDDYDDSNGYSTIDPRLGFDITSRLHNRFVKHTTQSEMEAYETESPTITYESRPQFNVLDDVKLLNLYSDERRVTKLGRTTTPESFVEEGIQSFNGQFGEGSEEESVERQVFVGCGKVVKPLILASKDEQMGEAEIGSHPWLAILVPTRKLSSVLCYASLIHPRAAISAADCVARGGDGDITLTVGLWNLNDRSRGKSRVISKVLHPNYHNGKLNNDLAFLHWEHPLKLGLNVQPICLANPDSDDMCVFVGWGGFDQAIRPKSRWQRAIIHKCSARQTANGLNIPSDAFCATVQARNTVTGIGASLVCNVNGVPTAVGIVVSRDNIIVLLPLYEWATEVIDTIQD